MARIYYVYALNDPRKNPAAPFYIGKGTGTRAEQHLANPGRTAKGKRIAEIRKAGKEPIVEKLVLNVAELEALRIEAELIAAFGVEQFGGLLTNTVTSIAKQLRKRAKITVPIGAVERAAQGLEILKDAVLALAEANPDGIANSDVANYLGLQSDHAGGSINYLSYSLIGILMREGRLAKRNRKFASASLVVPR